MGYDGPAPLLSVGYLSGFNDSPPYEETALVVKHLVVNGAFNPGNSGGPLFITGNTDVIGVVVSKHAPITHFVSSAIDELAKTRSGLMYPATDEKGNRHDLSEAQIMAEVLQILSEDDPSYDRRSSSFFRANQLSRKSSYP